MRGVDSSRALGGGSGVVEGADEEIIQLGNGAKIPRSREQRCKRTVGGEQLEWKEGNYSEINTASQLPALVLPQSLKSVCYLFDEVSYFLRIHIQ